jgi:hypothetical protein
VVKFGTDRAVVDMERILMDLNPALPCAWTRARPGAPAAAAGTQTLCGGRFRGHRADLSPPIWEGRRVHRDPGHHTAGTPGTGFEAVKRGAAGSGRPSVIPEPRWSRTSRCRP